jgi:hypothetical protein
VSDSDGFDQGWDAPRRRQARLGLKLTPAERLRWLEESLATIRRWHKKAKGPPAGEG